MRIWLWKYKTFLSSMRAFMVVGLVTAVFCLLSLEKFNGVLGDRTFYLYSVSSQSLQKEKLFISELFSVTGESVQFAFEGKPKAEAEWLVARFGGRILFTEEVAGVVSYYAYTPNFFDGVTLNGVRVNLHIAFCEETGVGVIGSPIIFGGF